MKGCPRCESVDAWMLGDGRRKCRCCGRRYRWKSVWDSVRLSESDKRLLLDAFVHSLPAAQCLAAHACADSRERFYRLIRACCVKHERPSGEGVSLAECSSHAFRARPAMRGWTISQRVIIVGFAERDGLIHITAPSRDITDLLAQLRESTAVGGVMRLSENMSSASLRVHGDYVIVPRVSRVASTMNSAEAFWRHARQHLQVFRKIPLKFFRLYLAEACLRFNQRDQDLHSLLREVMETTDIGALQPLLRGDSVRIGQGESTFVPAAAVRHGTLRHSRTRMSIARES
jgi:transposase